MPEGPLRSPTPRVVPWLAAAAAAFALSVVGSVGAASRGALPADLARSGPVPSPVGGVATGSWEQVAFEVQRLRPGTPVDLGTPREVVLRREVDGPELVLLVVSALAFCGLAALLVGPRAGDPATRRVFGCLVLGGLAVALVGVYPARDGVEEALAHAYVAVLAALPVAFVALAVSFPYPVGWVAQRPWTLRAASAVAAMVAGAQMLAWHRYFGAPSPATFAATRAPTAVGLALLVLGMGLGCVVLATGARRSPSARSRAQARWLLGGIGVAAVPFVLLRAVPRLLLGTEPSIPPVADRAVELAAPAAFAVAAARHRLLGIDVAVRRATLYTATALALCASAGGLVLAATAVAFGPAAARSPVTWLATGVLAGMLVGPVRKAVASRADGTFFRVGAARRDALRALGERLARTADPSAAAAETLDFVRATLRPVAAAVVVEERPGERAVAVHGFDGDLASAAHAAAVAQRLGATTARPDATAVPSVERPTASLDLLRASVVQPVVVDGALRASVWLGARGDGRHWLEEELAGLAALAEHAGPAFERLRLVREATREAASREALADLDRRRTDFLLRVAHDLRSPLTAVRWSLDNVLDGLSGPLAPAQAADLEGARAGVRQLQALVENVLTASRMAVGAPPPPLEPVALGPAVRDAAAALAPLAAVRDVRLALAVDGAPTALARREGVLQIVQNLVDNAVKHAPPGSVVEVRVTRAEPRSARIEVLDRGPGLPPGDAARLFDRFRVGPSAGGAPTQGLGIGLHVVRTWTEAFGGSARALAREGGGAAFEVVLPTVEGST
ncbi:MAG: hypothetical protein IT460_02845 [Planctomycetes bacterium]|nr:hypothetical protein [Planctomycetota bacterium]